MPELLPHQQRVVAEKLELDEKIAKLTAFMTSEIHAELPNQEKALLDTQLMHMNGYSQTLGFRIANF